VRDTVRGATSRRTGQIGAWLEGCWRCAERNRREAASIGRVTQIENGKLTGIDALDWYVHVLGCDHQIVADSGDGRIKVGRSAQAIH
jgi:hypothetical protein